MNKLIVELLLFLSLFVIWYLIGFYSYVYWWTQRYDFTTRELPFAFFISLFGPITFVTGWSIFGTRTLLLKQRTIFERKNHNDN